MEEMRESVKSITKSERDEYGSQKCHEKVIGDVYEDSFCWFVAWSTRNTEVSLK